MLPEWEQLSPRGGGRGVFFLQRGARAWARDVQGWFPGWPCYSVSRPGWWLTNFHFIAIYIRRLFHRYIRMSKLIKYCTLNMYSFLRINYTFKNGSRFKKSVRRSLFGNPMLTLPSAQIPCQELLEESARHTAHGPVLGYWTHVYQSSFLPWRTASSFPWWGILSRLLWWPRLNNKPGRRVVATWLRMRQMDSLPRNSLLCKG